MEQSRWDAILQEYGQYMALERGLSRNSFDSYGRDIRQFAAWLYESHELYPPDAQAHHIENYMARLYDLNKKKTSQARILSGLKSFYSFLVYAGHMEDTPTEFIEHPKISRNLPDTLSVREVDRLLEAIDSGDALGERNRAILEMLYSCGLRVSEAVSLRLSDLFFEQGYVRVTGKGDKQRLVPVSREARRRVESWLSYRGQMEPSAGGREVLFLNRRGGPLSRVMVFNIMKDAALRAGIRKRVSPHTLRHSFATHLLEGGANIRQIQEMLGHESIVTTEIYTHLDQSHLGRTLEEKHPLESK